MELVITLPLLLVVMALTVNFGHAAIWKVRAATAGRLAIWRHRPLWNADSDPKPANFWPENSSMSIRGGSRISQVDEVWNHPNIAQGWIKGPSFSAGSGYLNVRDNRVNEMSEGMSIGTAAVALRYPFLPSMGMMNMRSENTLLNSVWQYFTMGYSWNDSRRAKGWWQIEDCADWAAEKQEYLDADRRMVQNSQRDLLTPLDRDLDLMAMFGRNNRATDFYSEVPGFCLDDPREIQRMISAPGGVLDDIRGSSRLHMPGVCERMATSYLRMYEIQLAILEGQENPPADRIAQLKVWIEQLKDFIAKLQKSS